MKRSTKFWIVVAILFLVGFDLLACFKHYNDLNFILLVIIICLIQLIGIGLVLSFLIPKFNAWLDKE